METLIDSGHLNDVACDYIDSAIAELTALRNRTLQAGSGAKDAAPTRRQILAALCGAQDKVATVTGWVKAGLGLESN